MKFIKLLTLNKLLGCKMASVVPLGKKTVFEHLDAESSDIYIQLTDRSRPETSSRSLCPKQMHAPSSIVL